MHEPPASLDEAQVAAALREHYGIAGAALRFLPLGHDAAAWVYRVDAPGGPPRFLKLRAALTNPAGLVVPRHLRDRGAERVVAPIPTLAGGLWAAAAGYTLILYPFVDGESGMQRGLSPEQWRAYGAALAQIHAAPLSAELAGLLRREDFRPAGADLIRDIDRRLAGGPPADQIGRQVAALWAGRRGAIHELLGRAEGLGRRLALDPPASVLCHADIHTNNLLLDQEGQLWVVDWDESQLAPRERDLMFVVGGISARLVGPQQEAWFFEGYGPAELDRQALAYYRCAWAIGDIAAYAAEALRPDRGPASRQAAAGALAGLFAPGEIVAIASRSSA